MSELLDSAADSARALIERAGHIYVIDVPLLVLAGAGVVAAVTLLAAAKWIR